MLWVTWRQHRAELLTGVLLLAAVAVPLLITGLAMHHEYRADGIAACVADPAARPGCDALLDQFVGRHTQWGNRLLWGAFLPALAGMFAGAPLLAREYEQGTWRLAFTQSVSRTRWLLTKLALTGAAVAAIAATAGLLFTWWRTPLNEIEGRLQTASFLVAVPSLTAATVFGFALGVFAGALLRRTVVAMAATFAGFLAVRLTLEEYGRPHYRPPSVRITGPQVDPAAGTPPGSDWVVEEGWVDAAGRMLSEVEEGQIVREVYAGTQAVHGAGTPLERFMLDHGLRHRTEFHPDGGFWTFQAIEAGLFLALAAVLLAVTVRLVRRRT